LNGPIAEAKAKGAKKAGPAKKAAGLKKPAR
jgi:hypothetical protein